MPSELQQLVEEAWGNDAACAEFRSELTAILPASWLCEAFVFFCRQADLARYTAIVCLHARVTPSYADQARVTAEMVLTTPAFGLSLQGPIVQSVLDSICQVLWDGLTLKLTSFSRMVTAIICKQHQTWTTSSSVNGRSLITSRSSLTTRKLQGALSRPGAGCYTQQVAIACSTIWPVLLCNFLSRPDATRMRSAFMLHWSTTFVARVVHKLIPDRATRCWRGCFSPC